MGMSVNTVKSVYKAVSKTVETLAGSRGGTLSAKRCI